MSCKRMCGHFLYRLSKMRLNEYRGQSGIVRTAFGAGVYNKDSLREDVCIQSQETLEKT